MRLRTIALIATALAAAILPASPTSAQDAALATPSVAPSRANAGTAVTVSGTGCLLKDTPGALTFGFAAEVSGAGAEVPPTDNNQADATGAWSITIQLPTHLRNGNGEPFEIEPGDRYVINAVCTFPDTPSEAWLAYPAIPFEITGPVAAGTPSNPERGSAAAPVIPTSPGAAVAIPTTPRFTG